jgi:peptide/nickel transport system substrate-binding protein
VTFHNGNPFNADDVVFSITRTLDPANKSELNGYFTQLKSASKVDDYTVDVVTNGPSPNILTILALLPIMDQEWVEADSAQLSTKANGTGPFQLTDWRSGVSLVLERHADYWGQAPDVDSAEYRFLHEANTRLAALLTGEADVVARILPEYVEQVEDKGLQVVTVESLEFPLVRMSQFRGIMASRDLRLAANYAIDREAIIEGIYGGFAVPANGQAVKPGFYGFNPNLKDYPYDPEKAKELLKSAGYKGENVQLYGESSGRWVKDREVVEAVADMLRAVGFNIELKITGWEEYLDVLLHRDKAPDMDFVSAGSDTFDADRTFGAYIESGGAISAFLDKDIEAEIAASRQATTLEEREALQQKIQQEIYDEAWAIILCNNQDIYGMSNRMSYTPRQDGKLAVYEMQVQ